MLAGLALARGPLAGPEITDAVPPGQQLPPDGGTVYYYDAQVAARPLAMAGLAGAGAQNAFPGGGIGVDPLPQQGVMRVRVWWPNATGLLLLRITPDGVATPVRGGYPITTGDVTRTNYSTNPSVETATTGYTAIEGTPTLTRVVGGANTGTAYLRATIASAGSCGVGLPHTQPVATGVSTSTVALALRFSARPSSLTLSLGANNIGGGGLTASTTTLGADDINRSVSQWARQVMTVTLPTGAATITTIKIVAGGMPAGGTVDIDAVTIEQGTTTGSYIDGDTSGGQWLGTAGQSTSVAAPVLTLLDGEVPLDTAVSYQLTNPALTGGRMSSAAVVVDSLGYTWLTHPTTPSTPITVNIEGPTMARDYVADQGVFAVIGRARPVVVSAASRRSATGSISIGALSRPELATLTGMLDDLAPVLLRTPAGYDPPDMWLALGSMTVDPGGRMPWQETRLIKAPFVEVDPPDPIIV